MLNFLKKIYSYLEFLGALIWGGGGHLLYLVGV